MDISPLCIINNTFIQVAITHIKLGQDRCARTIYNDILNKATQDLLEAKKDNEFIYHERIPNEKDLMGISRYMVAKTSTVPPKLSAKFKGILIDIFNLLFIYFYFFVIFIYLFYMFNI